MKLLIHNMINVKYLSLLILIISTIKVNGQNHLIGVIGGTNLTNIATNMTSSSLNESNYRKGLTAGITYMYLIRERFSIGADFIYNQRGYSSDIIFTDDYGNPTGEKHPLIYDYDYVSLPIKTGFNIGNKLYGFTTIGIIPSILVNAKMTEPTFEVNNNSDVILTGHQTIDISDFTRRFDLAGFAEIGGGYKFKDCFWLFTSFTYQHSFTTIENKQIRHNGMTVSIGVKSVLTKK